MEDVFTRKVNELLAFLKRKDRQYAGSRVLSNITDSSLAFGINPINLVLARINDKWRRIRNNYTDRELLREELRDIWGYCLIALVILEEEEYE